MIAKQLIQKLCRSSAKCYFPNRNEFSYKKVQTFMTLHNQAKYQFAAKQDDGVEVKVFKKKEKNEQDKIVDPIVMDYVLEQIQTTNDPEKLEKIAKILDEIERREAERQKNMVSQLNTHPDVLSETDVYRAVQSLVDTPEDKLIKSIENNLPIDHNIWKKKIKKRISTIPTFQVLRLLKTVFNLEMNNIQGEFTVEGKNQEEQEEDEEKFDDGQEQQESLEKERIPIEVKNMCTSIWNTVESEFTKRLKHMSIDEIARTVRLYAHANRSNPQFFREIENELFERDMEYVNYRSIGMILEGFSHANLGTTTLYGNLARTIKVAQSEIHPLELAKYAYYFSKTPENIEGGFGVYKIAEEKLNYTMELMEFTDLVKLSKYFIAQNIGSNAFLQKIEKKLIDTYPSKQYGGISPNYLTKLIKNTSKHYFQYNDKALFHTLEADAIKQIPYMTVHQLQTILWSYSRSRRGNNDLYAALEKAILKKLKFFKPRAIAFAYYQFSFAHKGSEILFQRMEERILELGISNFSAHYLVKILSGINMRNAMESLRDTLLMPILKLMSSKAIQSKYSEALTFLYLLVELPPYQIKNSDEDSSDLNIQNEYDILFKEFEANKFTHVANQLKIDEVSQLYFAYRQANIGSSDFISTLEQRFEKQTEVPKPYFCRTVFSLVQHLRFDLANEFIPIVKELMKYGDIKYFFSHDDFIRLVWSLLLQEQAMRNSGSMHPYDEERYFMKPSFWLEEVYDAMFSINPNTVKFTALPLWVQNVSMLTKMKMSKMKKFQAKQREELLHRLIEKVDQIDPTYKQEYVKRDLKQFSSTKKEIHSQLENRMQTFSQTLDYQLVEDLVDEFLNIIDCALYMKIDSQILKIGVIILNEHHYSNRDTSNGHDGLLLQVQNKITLLQDLLDWQIIVIDEHIWNAYSEEEKRQFFFDNIELESEASDQTNPSQQSQQDQQN